MCIHPLTKINEYSLLTLYLELGHVPRIGFTELPRKPCASTTIIKG